MTKQSVQKARLVGELEGYLTKTGLHGTKLKYVHMKDDGTEKETTVQMLNKYLNSDSTAVLEKLKIGSEFVVVKEEQGEYWNFKELRDISTYVAKPAWEGGQKSGYTRQSGGKSNYDDTGVKVGASRNQAIAYLAATKGTKFTLDDVDTVAMEIVKRQAAMETAVRKENNTDKAAEENESKTQPYNSNLPPFF